jgi:hypothetical protein
MLKKAALMSNDLPSLRFIAWERALAYAQEVFTNKQVASETLLLRLEKIEATQHYRACFSPRYFVLSEGAQAPSKSQWNTLKKRMKRIHPRVFIFKGQDQTQLEDGTPCYTLEFGFFAH